MATLETKPTALTVAAAAWIVIGFIAFVAGWGIYQAWVVERIWSWYMVGRFHAPAISLGQCYVLVMLIRLIVPGSDADDESWKDKFWSKLMGKALMWAMLLGIAWWLR